MNHLQKLYVETFVLVKNNLCGKLVSSLEFPIKFDDKFKVTLAKFLILDFNLLSHFVLILRNEIVILELFFLKNLKLFLSFFNDEKQLRIFISF